LSEVETDFGIECAQVLRGMNDISSVETKSQIEQVGHFQELIVSYSVNPRIILLKLADRLEVMRSLAMFPDTKRTKKSWESLNIYAQIAHKLGLYKIKSELEDIALSYLEPDDYSQISNKLETSATEREQFITAFSAPIIDKLTADNLKFTIKARTKSIYSIWRKMKKQKVTFEEVYDVFAIRIVIDCPQEEEKSLCWHAYSIVTDFNKPNPERMRDWISIPKSNGYESLHATVVTDNGRWVEVQIRSLRMDEVAEQGIAAHWRYKGVEENSRETWLKQLREVVEGITIGSTTQNLGATFEGTDKEILVFTPNGDLRKLPVGSTILDFAFDIHTALGCKCTGGKVNHKNVTIKDVLKNGDLVEITTLKNQKPKSSWLNIAITSKAKNRIKAFLREEEAKRSIFGREELERKIKNWKANIHIDEAITLLTRYYKSKNGKEFLDMIADEKVQMTEIKELLLRHTAGENILRTTEERVPKEKRAKDKKGDFLIIDHNQKGIDYKLAKCCNPIYGDDIFSFVTVMNGITIHRSDCVNAARLRERFAYRILPARWNDSPPDGAFIAKLSIISDDVIGLEHSIRDALKELKINLRGMNMSYESDHIRGVITLEVTSIGYIDTIIYSLQKIKGIHKVYRI
ncbi:MAG: HD domain-containing protein, partial [Rikenellaceae bacterium]